MINPRPHVRERSFRLRPTLPKPECRSLLQTHLLPLLSIEQSYGGHGGVHRLRTDALVKLAAAAIAQCIAGRADGQRLCMRRRCETEERVCLICHSWAGRSASHAHCCCFSSRVPAPSSVSSAIFHWRYANYELRCTHVGGRCVRG